MRIASRGWSANTEKRQLPEKYVFSSVSLGLARFLVWYCR
jgi:hypothetical protein